MYNYQKLQVIRAKAKQSAGKDLEKPGRAAEGLDRDVEEQPLLPPSQQTPAPSYTNFRWGLHAGALTCWRQAAHETWAAHDQPVLACRGCGEIAICGETLETHSLLTRAPG